MHARAHLHTLARTLHTALSARGDGQSLPADGRAPRTGQPRQDPRFRVLLSDGYDRPHNLAIEGAHKAAFRALLYQPEGPTTPAPGTTLCLCTDEQSHQ
eukprot:scaffold203_cov386-Prasinococcus_capsulatus_cf.AAC.2